MHIKILGTAADGGFPNWNCSCSNCSGLREGALRGKSRTQTQIAFAPTSHVWFLVGASPDLRTQILATPELSASSDSLGHSKIAGVFLPNAEVATVAGLLHLRELQNYFIFATPAVQRIVRNENRIFKVLDCADPPVQWQSLSGRRRIGCHLSENPGDAPTFFYTAIPLGGDYPKYASENVSRDRPGEEASIALLLEQANKKLFLAPSISGRHSEWIKIAASADLALLDGRFWSDGELIATGRTNKTARELGHLPLSGPEGLLAQYPKDAGGRKMLVQLNHTNPILDESSDEHRAVVEAGFEIAYDGMEIEL
jgi:pyrroloquinoline quinone biosynthesis protein B